MEYTLIVSGRELPQNNKRRETMDYKFYDVKKKAAVTTKITAVKKYGEGTRVRFAVCGKTKDGRNLTVFVNKETFDKASKAVK